MPIPIEALRDDLANRFEVRTTGVPVGARTLAVAHPANADALISEADYVLDERLPYWADIWPSSRILAERVLRESGGGRRLLELGCGMGLVSSAAALAGFSVTATDYYVDAMAFARLNVWDNARCEIATSLLNWRHLPADLGTWDVVVASDVLYEKPYADLVAELLRRAVAPSGYAIIADPGRLALPAFLDACASRELAVSEPERVPWAGESQQQEIQLFVVRHGATVPR